MRGWAGSRSGAASCGHEQEPRLSLIHLDRLKALGIDLGVRSATSPDMVVRATCRNIGDYAQRGAA